MNRETLCPTASSLYWKWVLASEDALRIARAEGFTGEAAIHEQENITVYQQSFGAYRDHLRQCQTCKGLIYLVTETPAGELAPVTIQN